MMRELFGGSYVSEPTIHRDERGSFHEWFKASEFEAALGFPFVVQQTNVSVSRAGVLRGMHFADVPPGQAKFVACLSGRIVDVIADVRVDSPSFGKWEAVELSAENRHALFVPVGFAHGFLALEDATVAYLVSEEYNPEAEHEINAFDEQLAITWPDMPYIQSAKDKAAPALRDVKLPTLDECEAFENMLRDDWALANQAAGMEL